MGILNSERIARLARCLATFGSYEKGAIASLPVERKNTAGIASQSEAAFRAALCANSYTESDPHFFTAFRRPPATLRMFLDEVRSDIEAQASVVLNALDRVNREYRDGASTTQKWRVECVSDLSKEVSVSDVVSEFMGFAFGRWDIRYATGEQAAPELPDPFAPLPVCPPGQLQNAQGLPLGKEEVGRMKEEGIWNYPIEIPWDGILVDDPNHPLDIERRVREVIEIIWSGKEGGPTAEAIEHEACEILGVQSVCDYFRKPAGFFADHLKRYSKSRRQAPIYWPLSTASGSYTLWIYYHRLTDQTLHTVLADFLEPKIRNVQAELDAHQAGGNGQKAGESRDFLDELKDLRDEIERIIKLPWKPNLNDGVLITASPLWKLFRLTKWHAGLKACWEELEAGEYDWAHLAHSIWPQRVKKACETDRSIAIAHGLEHLCKVEPPKPKKKRAKTKNAAEQLEIQ